MSSCGESKQDYGKDARKNAIVPVAPRSKKMMTSTVLVLIFIALACFLCQGDKGYLFADVIFTISNTKLSANLLIGMQSYCATVITITEPKDNCTDLSDALVTSGTGGLYTSCSQVLSLCAASTIAQQNCAVSCGSCDKLSNKTLVTPNQDGCWPLTSLPATFEIMASPKTGKNLKESITTGFDIYKAGIAFTVLALLFLALAQTPHCAYGGKPFDMLCGADKTIRPHNKLIFETAARSLVIAGLLFLTSPAFFLIDSMVKAKDDVPNPNVKSTGGFGFQFYWSFLTPFFNWGVAYLIYSENAQMHVLVEAMEAGEVDLIAAMEAGIIQDLSSTGGEKVRLKSATADVDLCNAARAGMLDLVKDALQEGADTSFVHPQHQGRNALLLSVRNKHFECMKHLVKVKSNVNQCDEHGVSPLMYAAAMHKEDFAEVLIDAGAEVNHRGSKSGKTALEMADTGRKDCPDEIITMLGGEPPSIFARAEAAQAVSPAETASYN